MIKGVVFGNNKQKEIQAKFEVKMYSLYAQSIKEATDEQLLNVLCSLLKDEIAKNGLLQS